MVISKTLMTAVSLFVVLNMGCTKTVSFKQDVFPILSRDCLSCHSSGGEGYAKSGLSMENYETLMKGTKFAPVVVPGSSVSSTLIILVEHKGDPSINMPKHKEDLSEETRVHLVAWKSEQLSAGDIKVLKDWIDQGAKNN